MAAATGYNGDSALDIALICEQFVSYKIGLTPILVSCLLHYSKDVEQPFLLGIMLHHDKSLILFLPPDQSHLALATLYQWFNCGRPTVTPLLLNDIDATCERLPNSDAGLVLTCCMSSTDGYKGVSIFLHKRPDVRRTILISAAVVVKLHARS
jgi:hypothetical protein